ncbi:hypothetical protein F2Q70_00022775 [Brassica cretica]|uniref:Uncharacterized protein n=1 Tax=Brassica cretica TaxID=69181 RepID=A0A8S9GLJ9_BRACR|nr:hypothetical protein F2Q70_00022775 [Brassica cretica]
MVSRRGWYLGILAVKSDFGLRSGVDLGETSYLLRFCWASEILRRRARGCVGCCVVATAAVLFVYRCRSRRSSFPVRRSCSPALPRWRSFGVALGTRFGRTTSECGSHCTRFTVWFALVLKPNRIMVTFGDLGGTSQWAQLELFGKIVVGVLETQFSTAGGGWRIEFLRLRFAKLSGDGINHLEQR